jgi:ketosteroid isomerase-like protein
MQRLILTLIIAATIIPPLNAQRTTNNDPPDAEESQKLVLGLENQMNQAILQKDAGTLARIYADGLVYVNGKGEMLNKTQALADYRSGNNTLLHLNHDDIKLRVYGDTIVLTGRSNSTVRYKGETLTIPRRFTNVFLFLDGRWQIISHQVSNVEQPGK